MINVSGLVGAIPTSSVTIRTYGTSTVNAYGETTTGSATDTTTAAVVHPATADVLARVPEADRHIETIVVYSTAALPTVGSVHAALVYYEAVWYEFVDTADYGTLGGIYYSTAQRLETQPSAP